MAGALSSATGGPAAGGTYAATFAIYSQAVGGTAVWTEPATLVTKGGQFGWQLGSKTPLSAVTLNIAAAFLGVTVGTDPELPRQPLGGVLYAQRAAVAEGLDCSGCIQAASLDAKVLQAFAKVSDLDAYAKVAALAAVAGSGSYRIHGGTPCSVQCNYNVFFRFRACSPAVSAREQAAASTASNRGSRYARNR